MPGLHQMPVPHIQLRPGQRWWSPGIVLEWKLRLRQNLQTFRRDLRERDVPILVEHDELATRVNHGRFRKRAVLPEDFAGPDINSREWRRTVAGREIHRVAQADRVAMM